MKILFFIIMIFCTGCSNFNELEELAITSGIYIDKISNHYEIGLEILNSKKTNNGNEIDSYIVRDTCDTIDYCFSKISSKLSKTIYLAHTELLMVNKKLIDDRNLKDIIDYIVRSPDFRTELNIVITPSSSYDIYNEEYIDKIVSKQVLSTLKQSYLNTNTFDLFIINNFIKEQISYIPLIDYNDKHITINGITVFKDFNKTIEVTNYREYLLLTNQIKQNTIKINCDDNYIIFDAIDTKVKPDIKKDKVIFNVSLELKITDDTCSYDLRNKQELQDLISKVNNDYKEKLIKFIDEVKLNNLGIKYLYYLKYHNYQDLKNYDVVINANISKKGLLTDSIFEGDIHE